MSLASLIVSSLAFVVSAATFYRTHLRRKAAMLGWIADTFHDEDDDKPRVAWVRGYGFALSNTGTLDLLVRETSVHVCGKDADSVPEIPLGELPAILKPGEIRLIRLELPHRFVEAMEAAPGVTVSIEFQVYSAHGKLYTPRKRVIWGRDQPRDFWAPFALKGAEG